MHKSTIGLKEWLNDDKFYSEDVIYNEAVIMREVEDNVLSIFHESAEKVPAYKDFLKKNKIDHKLIKKFSDYDNIPSLSKENYIQKYPLEMRCWGGRIELNYMISSSSGTTGLPHYWPRNIESLVDGAKIHEFILADICRIRNKKTLFINGFALGNWIAGTFTSECVNLVSMKGYSITTTTPGYSIQEVVKTLKDLSKYYEKVVICGHTPFLKEVLEDAEKNKLDLRNLNLTILGTGQSITENWRDYILQLVHSSCATGAIFNLYGSADAALMGFETPLSIYYRKAFSANSKLAKEVFLDERLPSLYQYDPRLTYFEVINKELHITKYGGVPLIKYNIQDQGGIMHYADMIARLDSNISSDIEKKLSYKVAKFPFVYLYGREKFMVKLYGANIYTEHVHQALNHKSLQKYLTGRFILSIVYDKMNNPRLHCFVQLSRAVSESKSVKDQVSKIFVGEVKKLNSEYNDVLSRMGKKAEPKIVLVVHEDEKFFPKDNVKKSS